MLRNFLEVFCVVPWKEFGGPLLPWQRSGKYFQFLDFHPISSAFSGKENVERIFSNQILACDLKTDSEAI